MITSKWWRLCHNVDDFINKIHLLCKYYVMQSIDSCSLSVVLSSILFPHIAGNINVTVAQSPSRCSMVTCIFHRLHLSWSQKSINDIFSTCLVSPTMIRVRNSYSTYNICHIWHLCALWLMQLWLSSGEKYEMIFWSYPWNGMYDIHFTWHICKWNRSNQHYYRYACIW